MVCEIIRWGWSSGGIERRFLPRLLVTERDFYFSWVFNWWVRICEVWPLISVHAIRIWDGTLMVGRRQRREKRSVLYMKLLEENQGMIYYIYKILGTKFILIIRNNSLKDNQTRCAIKTIFIMCAHLKTPSVNAHWKVGERVEEPRFLLGLSLGCFIARSLWWLKVLFSPAKLWLWKSCMKDAVCEYCLRTPSISLSQTRSHYFYTENWNGKAICFKSRIRISFYSV